MTENNTTPSTSFLQNVLSAKVPGTGLTVAGLILSIFAILGSIPVVRLVLQYFIKEDLILSSVTLVVSAILIYYLLIAESKSEWLMKHPMAFVVVVLLVMLAAYSYVPQFKTLFGASSETVSQVATLLIHP